MTRADLSIADARRIALFAQGFDRPRPRRAVGAADVLATIRRLGLLQIDYVNVLVPAQYQVLAARLGPYSRALLDDALFRTREVTEHWAHEASILPVESWPLLRHRMDTHRARPWGFDAFLEAHPEYVAWVLHEIRRKGPLTASELPHPPGTERRLDSDWYGTVPGQVLEAHFGRGLLAIADRRRGFARAYDLSDRIVPAEHLARRVSPDDAKRELLRLAGRAHGVGTAGDLADYYRMPIRDARPRLQELVESRELEIVTVDGWSEPAFLSRSAAVPARVDARTLLSPFDPVVWYRPRAERLFDFEYRIEIFVPEEKRRWGYYVLPFLLGDRLVARVDLKADRAGRRLLVPAAHLEAGADPVAVAEALARELRVWASWLGLESVRVGRRGDLARALAAALKSGS